MTRAICAASVALLLAASARAQDTKPNFSGTWSIDLAKSDFGPAPPPESVVHVIEHKEPSVKDTATQKGSQGEVTSDRTLTTDGKENTYKLKTMVGEQDVKATSHWDGRKLATVLKFEIQGAPVNINEAWELSADGKVLTIVREIKSPQGEFTQRALYNKQ